MSKSNQSASAELPVYLDNAASTPMDERVAAAMIEVISGDCQFGNSASKTHKFGWIAAEIIEKARDQIAQSVGCSPLEIIFTSGATESNNLAIKGISYAQYRINDSRRHIVTTSIEHKSVLECCEQLEHHGFKVTYIKPRTDGTVSAQMVSQAISEDTFLVSIGHANSVLGSINDIESIARLCREHNIAFHSDCAQTNGLIDLKLDDGNVSMATLTPEKIYGPKGIGALYIKKAHNIELDPLIVGGGHEKGLRGGTLATHQIAGMGAAFEIMKNERDEVFQKLVKMHDDLIPELKASADITINGYNEEGTTPHLPHIISITFNGSAGRNIVSKLSKIACSTGSACSSSQLLPNYVLTETGLSDDAALSTLRFSLGRFTTNKDLSRAIAEVARICS